ncbi:MAG: tRNA (adenosine(37)-N6)-threonylcarbamoyltransferase complex ATPase subunit type 1 TsaE [bacterium]|nr:tRNA (adenosine(37)-N6)-threonylcarbamoyltransferase complex ATPase subunit type 1 TsaE [bacterium]
MSHSEADTERIAAHFAKTLRGGEVVLLDGDLGAGKTVFVRGLARGLGIHGRITSPTFVLMRVHEVPKKRAEGRRSKTITSSPSTINSFVHVDAYRVRDARDLEAVGLFEWIGRPDAVVAIEWGERVEKALRRFRPIRIAMRSTTGDDRRVVIRRP